MVIVYWEPASGQKWPCSYHVSFICFGRAAFLCRYLDKFKTAFFSVVLLNYVLLLLHYTDFKPAENVRSLAAF